jgi:Second Messenger Oligonucleotide or Dinucleotide Synthetase domain
MNAPDLNHVTTRQVTADASARFTYLTEAIAKAFEPTATQLAELERAYVATGEYLIECPEFAGTLTHIHAHGSRQLGTIVRPLDVSREGFDIDLVARLSRGALTRYGGEAGPSLLLQHLSTALGRYADRHGLSIKKWERCVTLTYAGGMCADFAPVIDDPMHAIAFGEHHGRIPDRELKRYAATNPKGYCLAFDEIAKVTPTFRVIESLSFALDSVRKADVEPLPDAQDVLGRLLSRFVQIAKVHRNHAFANVTNAARLAPTSVFLTSLIAKAYAILAPKVHEGPLDLFMDIVELLPFLFERQTLAGGGELWFLDNPCALADNAAASMNTAQRQEAFRQWHDKLSNDLAGLLKAINTGQGADIVAKAVESAFGARARQSVLAHTAQRRDSLRSAGKAAIFLGGVTSIVAPARAHTYFGGAQA